MGRESKKSVDAIALAAEAANLDALVKEVLKRPVAYHPLFAKIAGSVTAGVMLAQAWYWKDKGTQGPPGWFYKSQKEWEKETGLSRYEQETAREKLIERGFLKEEKLGQPRRLWFFVETENIARALLEAAYGSDFQYAEIPHASMRETSNQVCGKPTIQIAEIPHASMRENHMLSINTESTSESSSESTPESAAESASLSPAPAPPLRSGGRFAPAPPALTGREESEADTPALVPLASADSDKKIPDKKPSLGIDDDVAELLAYQKEKTGIEEDEGQIQAARWVLREYRKEECKDCFDYLLAELPAGKVSWINVFGKIGPWLIRRDLEAESREARQTAAKNREATAKPGGIACQECGSLLNPGDPKCPACGKATTSGDVSAEASA